MVSRKNINFFIIPFVQVIYPYPKKIMKKKGLNKEQKKYLEGIESNKKRKKLKKCFIKENSKKPLEDYKLFLEDFFSTVTNPLFKTSYIYEEESFKKIRKTIKKQLDKINK